MADCVRVSHLTSRPTSDAVLPCAATTFTHPFPYFQTQFCLSVDLLLFFLRVFISTASSEHPIPDCAFRMPRPTRGSQKAVKREEDDIDSKDIKPIKPVSAAKRKADSVPDADSKAQAPKAVKKRKGQAKGDEAAMPLVERTAVSSLSKAMYIGAHISAAGGISP